MKRPSNNAVWLVSSAKLRKNLKVAKRKGVRNLIYAELTWRKEKGIR